MTKLISLFFIGVLFSGCVTQHIAKYDVASKDSDLKKTFEQQPPAARVRGESCRTTITVIPLSGFPDLIKANADALSKAPGAKTLLDVQTSYTNLFTFFYNKFCFVVEGTPVL